MAHEPPSLPNGGGDPAWNLMTKIGADVGGFEKSEVQLPRPQRQWKEAGGLS